MSNQAGLGIGDKVHNQEINEYPEEMREEYLKLSEWVREVYNTYGMRVWIRVIDPQSLVGLWKHVRYKVRKYPTFVLDSQDVFKGWVSTSSVISRIEELIGIRQQYESTEHMIS